MASICFIISIILCVISEIITVPLGKADDVRLNEQRIRSVRVRRALGLIQSKPCFAYVPQCHITNAEYKKEMNRCFQKLLHVPGMTNGEKGGDYYCLDHYLYRTYEVQILPSLVKCPAAKPKETTTTTTTISSNVVSATNPVTSPSKPATTISATKVSTTAQTNQILQAGIEGNASSTLSPKPKTGSNVTLST